MVNGILVAERRLGVQWMGERPTSRRSKVNDPILDALRTTCILVALALAAIYLAYVVLLLSV